mmetsp:Transcript_51879/g.147015  ORF Transcript_51879/g.147015 Transcript_51879/m.147015 type:complete len:253 (-) Transcript_51879:3-761(-)
MCRRTRPLTLYALPLSGLTANAAVASLAAALAFFIFISSSARFEIIIAVGAPTMMASVSLARAAALSPSSSNSADSPCNLFRRSICSSVSSLFIASPSGIGSPASSSAAPAQISSSSDRGSMTFSSTLGCSTCSSTVPLFSKPSQSASLVISPNSNPASLVILWCFVCADTSRAMRCFSMLIVAWGSICTETTWPASHMFLTLTPPRSSVSILTFTTHCSAIAPMECADRSRREEPRTTPWMTDHTTSAKMA